MRQFKVLTSPRRNEREVLLNTGVGRFSFANIVLFQAEKKDHEKTPLDRFQHR